MTGKSNPNRLPCFGAGVGDRAVSECGNDRWVPFIPLASPKIPTGLPTRFYNT